MKIFVSSSRVAELLARLRIDDLTEDIGRLIAALVVDPEALVGITFPPAHELLDLYSYRYSVDEIRDSRKGWSSFLSVLESRESPIGLASVKIGEIAAIVLVDEEVEVALAVLIGTAD